MTEIPSKEKAQEILSRINTGSTTTEDARIMGAWMRELWTRQRQRIAMSEPLSGEEESNWLEHAKRVEGEQG